MAKTISKYSRKRSRRARKVIDSSSSEFETEKENQLPSESPRKKSNLDMLLCSSSPNLGSKKECEEELKEIEKKYNLRSEKLDESLQISKFGEDVAERNSNTPK